LLSDLGLKQFVHIHVEDSGPGCANLRPFLSGTGGGWLISSAFIEEHVFRRRGEGDVHSV